MIKKGARAAEFENAIEWLALSGIVSRIYKVEKIKKLSIIIIFQKMQKVCIENIIKQ